MHLFEAIIALNFSICYGFQSLDDLENFYKSDPVFDPNPNPFGLPGKIQITLSIVRTSTETSFSSICLTLARATRTRTILWRPEDVTQVLSVFHC